MGSKQQRLFFFSFFGTYWPRSRLADERTLSRSIQKINSHGIKSDFFFFFFFKISEGSIKEKQKRKILKEVKISHHSSSPSAPCLELQQRKGWGETSWDSKVWYRNEDVWSIRGRREMEASGGKGGVWAEYSINQENIHQGTSPRSARENSSWCTEMSQPNSDCRSSHFTSPPLHPYTLASQTFSSLAPPHSLWDFSSPTTDQTRALSSESTES